MQHSWSCARICRRVALAFALILSFTVSAYAETATVGGVAVEYSVPKGYVLAAGKAYDPFYRLIRDAVPDFTIDGLYVPKSVDQLIQISGGDNLTQYLVVMHQNKAVNANFSAQDFEAIKQSFRLNQTSDMDGAAQDRMRQVFKKQGKDVNFSSVTVPLGIIEEGETHISTLALLKQRLEYDRNSVDVIQAVVTRIVLGGGKLLQISLCKTVKDEVEATLFQTEALAALDSMDFKESPAWRVLLNFVVPVFCFLVAWSCFFWGVTSILDTVFPRVRRWNDWGQ